MKIRIIAKPNQQGEVLWEDSANSFHPVEIICPIEKNTLQVFQKDWEQFLSRLMSNAPSLSECKEKLIKKSMSLEQIVFGNRDLPWKHPKFKEEIFLQTDPEFTVYPWEILTSNGLFFFEKENFYRGIRSENHTSEKREGTSFLLIENPVLETLISSVKSEGRRISEIFEDQKEQKIVRLKSEQFKLARFWDEISTASYLHYAGHAEKGKIPLPEEGLSLGEEIGRARLSNLKIVFLNSCHSAFEGENTSGLATQFLKSGASYVLGFLTPVETEIAEKIGNDFWVAYQKTHKPRLAFHKVQRSLRNGSAREYTSSLSFVCFSPEDKKTSKNMILTLLICSFLLLVLFTFHWIRGNSVPVSNSEEKSLPKTDRSKQNHQKNQTNLKEKIASLKDQKFKTKISQFLKEENPFLDQNEKLRILEEVFATDGTEAVKFYHFKQLTGME